MYKLKANLHIHTHFSDGVYTPKRILNSAKHQGLGMVAITDHNEIRGTIAAYDLAPEYGVIALLGVELFFMSQGSLSELLVYFRRKEDITGFMQEFRRDHFVPSFKNVSYLTALVRKYEGVCIAPHPYGHKGLLGHHEEADFDGIEGANSFISNKDNERAQEYLLEHPQKYKSFGGADTHIFLSSLGKTYTEMESESQISLDAFWENMKGAKNDIRFTAVGGSLSFPHRAFQELWCLIKATCYLVYQDVGFVKMHTFHNFKRHHRR